MDKDGQSRETPSATPAKPFLRALAGETLARPPVWLMRQAGRYLPEYRALRAQAGSFLDLCYNPELAAEVTLQPIRRYGLDAAILFSDILVVPHALGQALDYVEGEGPKLEPVTDAAGIARLSAGRLHEVLGPVYETVGRVAAALPPETALIGFAGAPWTVATYMVEGGGSKEYGVVKRLAYGEPETFGRLIDLLVEATVAYLLRQVAAGVHAVQLFDSWAGVLPEAEFERWVIAPTRRIVDAVRAAAPGVPIIGFPRGAGLLYERYLAGTGVDAVGLDTTVPPGWAAKALQPKAAVQGNLDPVLLLTGGEPMIRAADAITAALDGGPFVFNLGHGVLQKTPPEHVAALVRHLRGDRG
ncbi:uroporphyrinogen decarboxylase [Inquilinus ginsengisoli]|uniref:uroporphyrinogen decarboxylase n=1 Tax=Inquilinus ginsengisoli TaxID=363840 RepID=UPI003D244C54